MIKESKSEGIRQSWWASGINFAHGMKDEFNAMLPAANPAG